MSPLELDPRFTFDSFIVGPANRLASAASRRVAELPGSAYNPLFLYSASGLGKTHLITAIGHHARRLNPSLVVVYDTLEHFMEEAMSAIQHGDREAIRNRLRNIGLLMLDDVQFLAGQRGAQDELLRALDALSARSGQLVLASDRPPAEINDLDDRLLSRFAGGLTADIGVPEYETRVAIVNRKADERGQKLASGVAEALARISFVNVRELQGGLNRLLAIQELDNRSVTADEIGGMFGQARRDDFSTFLTDISGTVGEVVQNVQHERRIAAAILKYEAEGYATRRLEVALNASTSDAEVALLIQQYEQDVDRLVLLRAETVAIDPDAPELGDSDVFKNPDRVSVAESVVNDVRVRSKPLPLPPPHRSFETLTVNPGSFAVKVARAIVEKPGQEYNPLFIHGPEGAGKTTLLAALANEFIARYPGAPVAFLHARNFAAELIQALEKNASDSWRGRYRRARLFVLDDLETLVDTERAQDELFHLFEELRRNNAQIVLGSAAAPAQLEGLEDRLRTRFESGLVLQLDILPVNEVAAAAELRNQTPAAWVAAVAQHQDVREPIFDDFFLSREKVIWNWPYLEDCLFEELE